jgi:hypothetical protein
LLKLIKKIRAYLSEGQGIIMCVVRKALPAGLGKEREREREREREMRRVNMIHYMQDLGELNNDKYI